MTQNEIFLAGPEDASIDGGQLDRSGPSSRSNPEEGHRLMRAFLGVRQAGLRKALVNLVTELSALEEQGQ